MSDSTLADVGKVLSCSFNGFVTLWDWHASTCCPSHVICAQLTKMSQQLSQHIIYKFPRDKLRYEQIYCYISVLGSTCWVIPLRVHSVSVSVWLKKYHLLTVNVLILLIFVMIVIMMETVMITLGVVVVVFTSLYGCRTINFFNRRLIAIKIINAINRHD